MMKHLLNLKLIFLPLAILLALVLGVRSTQGATGTPQLLNYQGTLMDTHGVRVADNFYAMDFIIWDSVSGGSNLWEENWTNVFVGKVNGAVVAGGTSIVYDGDSYASTIAAGQVLYNKTNNDRTVVSSVNTGTSTITVAPTEKAWDDNADISIKPTTISGKFAVRLGSLNPSGNPLNLDFSSDTYYLGVNVAGDGEMTPRTRLTAAAYAYNASNLIGTGKIDITNNAANQMKVSYDGSNYFTVNVGATGAVTLDATGAGAAFTLQKNTTVTGNLQGSTVTDGTLTMNSGAIASGVTATFSGLVTGGKGNFTGTAANQLKVGYDNSNYYTANVSSAGAVTFDATGASAAFTFQDAVTFNGGLTVPASTAPTYVGNYTPSAAPTAYNLYISGKYAYLSDGASGLTAVDISVPGTPVRVGTYNTSGTDYAAVIDGRYAYVADGTSGLTVVDVANNYAMTYVGTYDTSGTAGAYDVYVSGKYAYVADDTSGLQIIDISNPAAPIRTGTYDTTGNAMGVYVVGKYAYVADATAGLTIIDVSTPAAPTYVGNYTPSGAPTASGVYVSGRYAYLADGASGVQIIDISNPASPSKTGTYDTTGTAYSVYVAGHYAYVADRDSGIVTLNVSTPSSPTYVGYYDTTGSAYGIQVVGRYAWVADATAGLTSINIGGADFSTVDTGNVTTGNLDVTDSTDIGQNLFVRGTLNVGIQGIQADGLINASGGLVAPPLANPTYVGNYTPASSPVAYGLYISGKYAYLADGASGLQAIDISVPTAPTKIGTYDTSGTAYAVVTEGKYAYVADGASGLTIVDISNNASMTRVGTYDTSGTAEGVYVAGKYAYVADQGSGLQIIDISNPAAPTRVGTYVTTGAAYTTYVSGKYAYVANAAAGLTIIDISTPLAPTYVGNYTPANLQPSTGVYVSGKYAYLATGTDGVHIINVSNPASPARVATYNTSGTAYNVYGTGRYVYVADEASGVTAIDVSTPASPLWVGTYNTTGTDYGVQVVGKYAWVADGVSGLTAVNIGGADLSTVDAGNVTTGNLNVVESADIGQNLFVRGTLNVGVQGIQSDGLINASGGLSAVPLSTPLYVGNYTPSGAPTAYDQFVSGKYAYLSDGASGLQIIDVSVPSSPTIISTYNTTGTDYSAWIAGKYAYVADGTAGLTVLDVTNPYSVTYVGNYDTSGTAGAYDVYVSGKYAYVADDDSGLQIIDVSTPSAPTRTGTYDTTGNATGVYVSGKYAYVADGTAGLTILDISTPASPTYVGNYNTSGTAQNVYLSGKYAYVADGASGVTLVNVSNPASPAYVSTYDTSGTAYNVYVSGKYAYVADRDSGMTILDVSTPTLTPLYVGNYNTTGSDYSVQVTGKYAWVADATAGLTSISIGGADLSTVDAGNVTTGNLNVTESTDIGQNLFVRGTLNVGVQGILSDGPISASNLQAVSTTSPQMTVKYDNSNYVTMAVSSAGVVTLDATGASAGFKFSDNVTFSGTAAGDAVNYGGVYDYITFNRDAMSAGTYFNFGATTISSTSGFYAMYPGSLTAISVSLGTAPGGSNVARIKVYKNGSATGLYVDITGAAVSGTATATKGSYTFAAGDVIQAYMDTDGTHTFGSPANGYVTVQITS